MSRLRGWFRRWTEEPERVARARRRMRLAASEVRASQREAAVVREQLTGKQIEIYRRMAALQGKRARPETGPSGPGDIRHDLLLAADK